MWACSSKGEEMQVRKLVGDETDSTVGGQGKEEEQSPAWSQERGRKNAGH